MHANKHRNLGHQPDMGALKLQGQSVIDLAMEAARMPVTLQEVQAHIMETNPEAYKVSNCVCVHVRVQG
mgnify:CR=1 FL=1